ncbi:MAG: response regulator [Rhodanobacteraceae bacterium]|nr:response regulator [Rhodanobacteraceae bacterium]
MSDLEHLRQLCADAKVLLTTAWDMEHAEHVCERAEELAEPLNDPRHTSLAEAIMGFAAYLSAFTDSRVGPIESRRLQLETLLDAVSEQLDRLETSNALEMAPPEMELTIELAPAPSEVLGSASSAIAAVASAPETKPLDTIVFIDPTGRDAGTLGLALEDVGYVVQPLLRLDRQIGQWLAKPEVKGLILPAPGLDVWDKLLQLDPALDQARRRIGLFVVARSDDPRMRLKAGQAGADGFFVLPGAVDALAREIVEVLRDRLDPYRALIIDDDVSMTMVVDSVLRRSGMDTRVINDPSLALSILDEFVPDVILLDLHMPGLSGLELLSLFRAHTKTAFTPVVLISGDENQERRFETLTAGGDDYLLKPLRPKHLVAAVTGRAQRSRWLRRALRHTTTPLPLP